MKELFKEKINQTLENMSDEMPGSRGCLWFWGETEIPECIREKYENDGEE